MRRFFAQSRYRDALEPEARSEACDNSGARSLHDKGDRAGGRGGS